MKILTTFVRHSHECRAKVRDKIRKTVARNSHASEILALRYFVDIYRSVSGSQYIYTYMYIYIYISTSVLGFNTS